MSEPYDPPSLGPAAPPSVAPPPVVSSAPPDVPQVQEQRHYREEEKDEIDLLEQEDEKLLGPKGDDHEGDEAPLDLEGFLSEVSLANQANGTVQFNLRRIETLVREILTDDNTASGEAQDSATGTFARLHSLAEITTATATLYTPLLPWIFFLAETLKTLEAAPPPAKGVEDREPRIKTSQLTAARDEYTTLVSKVIASSERIKIGEWQERELVGLVRARTAKRIKVAQPGIDDAEIFRLLREAETGGDKPLSELKPLSPQWLWACEHSFTELYRIQQNHDLAALERSFRATPKRTASWFSPLFRAVQRAKSLYHSPTIKPKFQAVIGSPLTTRTTASQGVADIETGAGSADTMTKMTTEGDEQKKIARTTLFVGGFMCFMFFVLALFFLLRGSGGDQPLTADQVAMLDKTTVL